ncbi:MAG TPA: 5'-nucleotidase C-terminal domain-containing protein, partial [Candidatus Acidoferrales bacterium]|nr:5'-nucleotidase C-terminal domain-containing protein [Candidatus Acidoferrales bacterium]
RATYDLERPRGKRLIELRIGNSPMEDGKLYRVATNSFLTQGGDLYETFLHTKQSDAGKLLSTIMMEYLQKQGEISAPAAGRLIPASAKAKGAE